MGKDKKIKRLKKANHILEELLDQAEERNAYIYQRLKSVVNARASELSVRRLVYGPRAAGKSHFVVNKLLPKIAHPVVVIDYEDTLYENNTNTQMCLISCLDEYGVKKIRSIHKKNPASTFIFEASVTGFFMGSYGRKFIALHNELKFNFIIVVANNVKLLSPQVLHLIDFTYCLGGVKAYRTLFQSEISMDIDKIQFLDDYNPHFR